MGVADLNARMADLLGDSLESIEPPAHRLVRRIEMAASCSILIRTIMVYHLAFAALADGTCSAFRSSNQRFFGVAFTAPQFGSIFAACPLGVFGDRSTALRVTIGKPSGRIQNGTPIAASALRCRLRRRNPVSSETWSLVRNISESAADKIYGSNGISRSS
jgi:hypothetical protein